MNYPHFLVHGASGAAITVLLCWILGAPVTPTIAIVGALVGMVPDIPWAPWYAACHYGGVLFPFICWIPPIGIHVGLVDYFYHKIGDWWNTYWWCEISLWVVSTLILFIAFI
jgi:hypothetical protein